MRACNSNNCPVGIATQKPNLRERLIVDQAAKRLERFLNSSVELMQLMARACGHQHLNQFSIKDLTTFKNSYGGTERHCIWRRRRKQNLTS